MRGKFTKRLTAGLLAALMLCMSVFTGSDFAGVFGGLIKSAAAITDDEMAGATALTLGTEADVSIQSDGQIVYFSFTPDVTCKYAFYSKSTLDTYGYFYNSTGDGIGNNDDIGTNNRNFRIESVLDAGTTYYFGAKIAVTNPLSGTGDFIVELDRIHSCASATTNNNGTHNKFCGICYEDFTEECNYESIVENSIAKRTCTDCGYTFTEEAFGEEIPAAWSFENDEEGWTFSDRDGDGYNWKRDSNSFAHDGNYYIYSRYNSKESVDNWAVSPAFSLKNVDSAVLSAWLRGNSTNFQEHFAFYAGVTDNPVYMTMVSEEYAPTTTFQNYTADLSDFVGESKVYVAIRHYDAVNQYYLMADNIEIKAVVGECDGHVLQEIETAAPTCEEPGCSQNYWQCTVCGRTFSDAGGEQPLLLSDIMLPATGHSWGDWVPNNDDTHTRTCSECNKTETDFCVYEDTEEKGIVKHECTVCGYSFAEEIGVKAEIAFWDFEGDNGEEGWYFVDADGDGRSWNTRDNGVDNSVCLYSNFNQSGNVDNWAVSPEFSLSGQASASVSLWANNYSSSYQEIFALYAGTSPDPDDMVVVSEDFYPTTTYQQFTANLSAFAGESSVYVAVRHYNCEDTLYLLIDNVEIIGRGGACDHILVEQPAVGATCTEDGHEQYWKCPACERTYLDAEGKYPVLTSELIVYPAKGHRWTDCVYEGNDKHTRTCGNCGIAETVDCTYVETVQNKVVKNICSGCGHTYCEELGTVNYSWNFDEGTDNWTFYDLDGDGYSWDWRNRDDWNYYEDSTGLISSASYINGSGAVNPDNLAVSPAFSLVDYKNAQLSLWARGQNDGSYYEEVFALYAGTTPVFNQMTKLGDDYTTDDEYREFTADLSAFDGEPVVYVAIRHYNCYDQYWLNIENVEVSADDIYNCNGNHSATLVPAVPATMTEDGNIAYYVCENCGRYFLDEECTQPVIIDDTIEYAVVPYGYSLSLEGDIGVNFYMQLSDDLLNSETAKMVFTVPTGDTTITQTVYVSEIANGDKAVNDVIKGVKYYPFKCSVAAKDMASVISAQIVDPETGYESDVVSYSVKDYAEYVIDHADAPEYKDAVNLVKGMLIYGAWAQRYFGVEGEDGKYADEKLDDVEKTSYEDIKAGTLDISYDPSKTVLPAGVKLSGVSLSLKSTTTLSLYFKSSEDLTFSCTNGNTVEVDHVNGYTVARIRGISAAKLFNNFTLTVNNGSESGTVVYCPMVYCADVINDGTGDETWINLCKSLVLYAYLANQYF